MDLSMKLRSELERLELRLLRRGRGSDVKMTIGNTAKDLIQELQRTRRLSGMPLNTTFTDITKVISMVKNTVRNAAVMLWGIHSTGKALKFH
jgi:hypothetical protein